MRHSWPLGPSSPNFTPTLWKNPPPLTGRLTQARALSRQRQSQFPPRSVRVQSPHLHRLASKKLRGALSTELDAGAATWDRAPGQRGPGLHGAN